jgi:hypothetical protein
VCEGLQWLGGGHGEAVQASKSAISQARTRLGPEVMQRLAQRVLRPLAPPGAAGAWYRKLRVMALDGSCLDVADERANAEFFGYPTATRGQSAFPQARVLGLVECGTHAIVAADVASYARSEKAMAGAVLPGWLRPDMLLLADRGLYSFKLWQLAGASGAMLLWRVSSTIKLPAQQVLADGSYPEHRLRQRRQRPSPRPDGARQASERLESWREALLAEIGRGHCVSSRGRSNPRGVKRKMSNFRVRRRGETLHRRHQPTRCYVSE